MNRIVFVALFLFSNVYGQLPNPIRVNQEGYYPQAPKTAVVVLPVSSNDFYLLEENSKDTVFRGKLQEVVSSYNSSLKTRKADFSSFQKEGVYRMSVPGIPASYPFRIRSNIHHDVSVSSIKGYYYQRASMPLEEQYAGKWARPAGHPDTRVLVHASAASTGRPAGTVFPSPGGWYDAGDYNKYVVNSGVTMGTLLSAYEDFPEYYDTLFLNIPESGNHVPDLLDEILYNLRWMLAMQDPGDGGVYHKCTNAGFDGMEMPAAATATRYVVQKGTAATLDFAAVAAQAARVFRKYGRSFPGLADSCLMAAEKAWNWALEHPDIVYDQDALNKKFDPDISTGAYGDTQLTDEWFWAACELYVSTGKEVYARYWEIGLRERVTLSSWGNVRMPGYYTLARFPEMLDDALRQQVRDSIVRLAEVYMEGMRMNAFSTVMGVTPRDFTWGSNSVAANQGVLLMNAYRITKQKKFSEAALGNLDYLLGRNATGYCFLTGAGSFSPRHPHHRPSAADGVEAPVPGLLAGGPNPGRQDDCTYSLTEPETCYSDSVCSFASNEIAINWNAPFVYLAAAVQVYFR